MGDLREQLMSAMGVSGPVITQVQLTGPADEVSRLMQVLSGVSEVIFGPVMQPGRGGDVSCTAQVVTHPPRAGAGGAARLGHGAGRA